MTYFSQNFSKLEIIGPVKEPVVLKQFLRVIISALNAIFVIQKIGILKNYKWDLIEPHIVLETLSEHYCLESRGVQQVFSNHC